ncbi:hypothetical protein IEQ34_017708 [Dendrobium chrysotoxum]|uniref:Regulatory protein RecX n=1 Tax=Dendrobium chrysotoxum TaxID=161865 RepID=A0AAV7GC21_DENCH|nr:hypothetical protein IEQ34_017708 [Dendrobium chrysotoxum]
MCNFLEGKLIDHPSLQMRNFATIRILCIYRGIEYHLFPVATLARKSYSTSGPIRYIPGRFAQINKTQNFPSLQDSAKKEAPITGNTCSGLSNLDCRRIQNGRFDDEILSQYDEPVRELFDIGYENMNELHTSSKADADGFRKTREEIEQVAVDLLAARAMTAIELRRKLHGKKYPSAIIESIVADFKSRGLLNDSMYAEAFTRSRWLSSTWGPRRIKQALLQKGVSEIETERARKQVFEQEDDPESDGQDKQLGMCKLSIDHLFLQASKQWLRSRNTVIDNRRARIVRWLQYRGFDWGVTNYILKKLESQYPS